MKFRILIAAFASFLTCGTIAQTPAPEKLLPNDTLALVTAPDAGTFRASLKNSAAGQFWNDPAMKPFKDKFATKFDSEILSPLEKAFGIQFSDYKNLAQGQVTFAVTQNGWEGTTNKLPGWILILDAKEKSSELKTNLSDLKKKWVDSGKQVKSEKIRDLDFTTLITSTDDLDATMDKIFPGGKNSASDEPKTAGRKLNIFIGQSGSLLLAGNDRALIEKVLVHQSGGVAPALTDEAAYQAHYNSMFRDAPFYVWLNVKPLIDIFTRPSDSSKSDSSADGPLAMKPEKIIASTGIGGLQTAAFSYRVAPEGSTMLFSLGIPEAGRQGIFKILAAQTKDAAPPAFVPADVTKFTRWRIDLPKAWTGVETMLTDISPAIGGAFKLIFESAGKDKDPNYDLKKELLANLGDDFINYERVGKGTLADLNSPSSIYLLGSPNPEKLASAIKVGMSLLAPEPITDREFLGRKVYKMPAPAPMGNAKAPSAPMNFAASGGYVALSKDVAMLEEFLRSSETKARPLSQTAGLNEAAEKVGGTGTGLFGYTNERDEMRAAFTALKSNSATLADLIENPALKPKSAAEEKKMNDWADFSLLPSFDAVSKYFFFSVYAGAFDASGFTVKTFYPTPPELKK